MCHPINFCVLCGELLEDGKICDKCLKDCDCAGLERADVIDLYSEPDH